MLNKKDITVILTALLRQKRCLEDIPENERSEGQEEKLVDTYFAINKLFKLKEEAGNG